MVRIWCTWRTHLIKNVYYSAQMKKYHLLITKTTNVHNFVLKELMPPTTQRNVCRNVIMSLMTLLAIQQAIYVYNNVLLGCMETLIH